MGLLNEEEYPIKRSGEQFKPALIYRNSAGNYSLLEAKSLRIGEKAPSKKVPPGFSDYKNGDVIYYQEPPKNDKGQPLTEGFKWFVNNHKTLSGGGMRGRNNVRIETVLPSILDEDVSMEYNLPSQTSRGGAKGFNGGSGKTSGNGRNRGNSQGNFRKNNQRGRH